MKAGSVQLIVAVVATLGLPTVAMAKSTKRTGINFGTTVGLNDMSDQSLGSTDTTRASKSTSNGTSVSPYLGYAFTSVNVGVAYMQESTAATASELSADGMTTNTRDTNTKVSGTSFFLRYLFASYFYFEAAGGLYQQSQNVHTETRQTQGTPSNFTGTQDDFQVNGIGPGYSAAGGMELPISNGFVFTTAYQVRTVQLWDHVNASSFGHKSLATQKNQLLFGIAYYDN